MNSSDTKLLPRLLDALRSQSIITALALIAAALAAVNTEITRRQTQHGSTGFWGSVRNSQILLFLTAGLSLLSVLNMELQRRTKLDTPPTIEAERKNPEQAEVTT